MYKNFLTICEKKGYKATVLDALYMYSKIDYLLLASKQLHIQAEKSRVKFNIIEPVDKKLVDKFPIFKDENKVLTEKYNIPHLNPYTTKEKQNIQYESENKNKKIYNPMKAVLISHNMYNNNKKH